MPPLAPPIPLSRPDLRGNEEAYLLEALRSGWISSRGHFLDLFEREFAQACEVPHALAVSNGTCALQLALAALGVGPGDEVLVPALTYVAAANAVRHCGAVPVFVDVTPETWTLDPVQAEARVGPRTRALIAVHLYGHPADMDALAAVARRHGLWLVEDAAEAPLARCRGRRTGGLGHVGTHSFFGNKILTCGEGGAVTTHDAALAARMRQLRDHGADPVRRYDFAVAGFNYRLTNVSAALLCAQLERAEELLDARARLCAAYRERLGGAPGLTQQPVAAWAEPVPWLYSVRVEPWAGGRDALALRLAEAGVETRPFFVPMHQLAPYRAQCAGQSFPVAEALAATGLNLPLFPGLTQGEVDHVCDVLLRELRATELEAATRREAS